eukprot:2540420-Pleurochrysis_carterae.AAC.2
MNDVLWTSCNNIIAKIRTTAFGRFQYEERFLAYEKTTLLRIQVMYYAIVQQHITNHELHSKNDRLIVG